MVTFNCAICRIAETASSLANDRRNLPDDIDFMLFEILIKHRLRRFIDIDVDQKLTECLTCIITFADFLTERLEKIIVGFFTTRRMLACEV